MSSKIDAQPTTVPMMIGVETEIDSGEGTGTMGLGASGTVVVLVALPELGGAGSDTVWQMGSDGERSQIDTD